MTFKIQKMILLQGTPPNTVEVGVEVPRVVLITGPNNSGKSLLLDEIHSFVTQRNRDRKIVRDVQVTVPQTESDLASLLNPIAVQSRDDAWVLWNFTEPRAISKNSFRGRRDFNLTEFPEMRNIADCLTLYMYRDALGATLGHSYPAVRLDSPPTNMVNLYQVNEDRKLVLRKKLAEVLGLYFCIDMTRLTELFIRFSLTEPPEHEEFNIRSKFFSDERTYKNPRQLGLGYQYYAAALMQLYSYPHKIVLFDEPDAFMHPPLRRRLGREMTSEIEIRNGTLIVATHSEDFVLGCLESSDDVAVVRLEYKEPAASIKVLPVQDVRAIMLDPFLRTSEPLRGLFHESAVVVEGPSDRAFYDEVNHILVREQKGLPDCLMLSAGNWQNIPRLVSPLRKAGVPAAGIMDFDAIVSTDPWEKKGVYRSFFIDDTTASELETRRREICKYFLGFDKKEKRLGVSVLKSDDEKAFVVALINELSPFGLFVIPHGTVEAWLRSYVPKQYDKSQWLQLMFAEMAVRRDEIKASPKDDDVWEFIKKIGTWVRDRTRMGMP